MRALELVGYWILIGFLVASVALRLRWSRYKVFLAQFPPGVRKVLIFLNVVITTLMWPATAVATIVWLIKPRKLEKT